eukprot:140068-Chlamydomonas_euryale.AAC.6
MRAALLGSTSIAAGRIWRQSAVAPLRTRSSARRLARPLYASPSTAGVSTETYSITNNTPMADNGNDGQPALTNEVEALRKQLASLQVRAGPASRCSASWRRKWPHRSAGMLQFAGRPRGWPGGSVLIATCVGRSLVAGVHAGDSEAKGGGAQLGLPVQQDVWKDQHQRRCGARGRRQGPGERTCRSWGAQLRGCRSPAATVSSD